MKLGKQTLQVCVNPSQNSLWYTFSALNQRCDGEIVARETEDKIINERIDKEISDREQATMDLQNRMDCQNDDKARELEELRERMMKENMYLNAVNHRTMSVYFDAFR